MSHSAAELSVGSGKVAQATWCDRQRPRKPVGTLGGATARFATGEQPVASMFMKASLVNIYENSYI